MPRILHVVGARPNFMKIAPILRELERRGGVENVLVHTGQHYDEEMSKSFFRDLEIREPDVDLGVGSGTHARQTAAVLTGMEDVLLERKPDLLVVVGDVNSTVAAALAAAKLHVPVAHVEAGLRSRDRTMPEEINRLVTDQMAELLLTPSRDGDENLRREGIPAERIHFVGNVMIDTLHFTLSKMDPSAVRARWGVDGGPYALATLHRPSNVDEREVLTGIVEALDALAAERPVLFPVHPRTRDQMERFGLRPDRLRLLDPLPHGDVIALVQGAEVVLTDSGGLQEETTALGVPCLTLRDSTERPITISEGTNTLVPDRSREAILEAFAGCRGGERKPRIPDGWDGRTAERIADVFEGWFAGR